MIDDDGDKFYAKASYSYRCGFQYMTHIDKFEIYDSPESEFVVDGYYSADNIKKELTEDYRKRLPRGQRPKVYLKRITGDVNNETG